MARRDLYLIAILGLAALNGQMSRAAIWVFGLAPAWYPSALPFSLAIAFYLSALLTSTLTIMAAGIPAAAYERFANKAETSEWSLRIWLFGVSFLCVPSLL